MCEPPGADVVAGAALCEPPCADFVAGTSLCEPPGADFVAGAALETIADARNAVFSIEPVASNLALWNDGCETVSGHARIIVGIVPPLGLEFSLVS